LAFLLSLHSTSPPQHSLNVYSIWWQQPASPWVLTCGVKDIDVTANWLAYLVTAWKMVPDTYLPWGSK
jgi:hypothetical protein